LSKKFLGIQTNRAWKENQDLHEKLHSARSQILASQKALNEVKRFKDRDQDGVPDLVAKLRVSLQQVQQDADEFRDDLARLREDKQTSEDAHRREIAQLQERLGSSREAKYDEGLHKDECRGLLVQISYLQDKWTREATFRYDLQFTKRYLLTLYAAAL
jgi:DNA repair exonuclease SbcCD ATPase subunit